MLGWAHAAGLLNQPASQPASHLLTQPTTSITQLPAHPTQGVNVTALREVKMLRELRSPHLVRLLDVLPSKRSVSLVFEFMESDLEQLIRDRSVVLSGADVKAYQRMVLQALAHCHARWVLHRDVKPNNFLVAPGGELKLADFGLARLYGSPGRPRYTNQVFARWYRPPELLYGSTAYGPSADVWAAGCIFAELMLRRPWFPGESDPEVLSRIYSALGTPTDEAWGGLRAMPAFVEYHRTPAPPLRQLFPQAGDDALDLLSRMMCFDAARRVTASDALAHRYFTTDPLPTPADQLPRPHRAVAQGQEGQAGAKRARTGSAGGGAEGEDRPAVLDDEDEAFLKKRRLAFDQALDEAG